APADRGQPGEFEPGRVVGQFQTPFGGATTLVWALSGETATASGQSTRCTATLELRKTTIPRNDKGTFQLRVNDRVVATGGTGTTTGPMILGVGEGTVSETAGPATDLADYKSRVDCTKNGEQVLTVPGTKVDGAVAQGDVVVCTFTNTRKTTPPPQP